MRTITLIAAAAAVSSVSAFNVFQTRQYDGCEDICEPMRGWSVMCRTNRVQCQADCSAEILNATDECFACIQEKNPSQAVNVKQYVGLAHQMCDPVVGYASASAAASAAPTSAEASADPSAEASQTVEASASATSAASAAPTSASAAASGASAAPTGSVALSGSAAPSGTGSAAAAASVSPSAAAPSPSGGAGKLGISLGAVALALSAFLV